MNERERIVRALAPLRASGDTVKEVLKMADEKKRTGRKRTGRVLLAAAAAMMVLAGAALGAGGLGLGGGLRQLLQLTEETASLAQSQGVLASPLASDTHGGVTISLERCVSDGETVLASFRIEGLEVPEGKAPFVDSCRVTIGGKTAEQAEWSIYRGLSRTGESFVYDDGTPAKKTASGDSMPRFVRGDGSIELDLSIPPGSGEELKPLSGRVIEVRFSSVGIRDAETFGPRSGAEGPWVLSWVLEGAADSVEYALNADLGDSGVTLTGVVLSPVSLRVTYDFPLRTSQEMGFNEYGETVPITVWEEPPVLAGLRLRDGTVLRDVTGGGRMGYSEGAPAEYTAQLSLSCIIDPGEVEALLFHDVGYGDLPDDEMTWYTVELNG